LESNTTFNLASATNRQIKLQQHDFYGSARIARGATRSEIHECVFLADTNHKRDWFFRNCSERGRADGPISPASLPTFRSNKKATDIFVFYSSIDCVHAAILT
jgi:hypothetical protein